MKKISKLMMFAVLALGLSFAACNNEDVPQGPDQQEGNTHVSVALSMSASNFKSAVSGDDKDFHYVGEWAGKDIIKTVSIYLVDPASTGPVTRRTFDVGSQSETKPYYTTDQSGGTLNIIPREAAAIKTTAGEKDVWVVVNENAVVQQHLATATATDFASKYQEIAMVLQNSGLVFNSTPATSATKLATLEAINGEDYDVIVMTNVEPMLKLNVAAGVTAEQTVGAEKPNRASLNVERAVARVLVTLKDGFTEVIKDANGATIGTISDVKWVLAQGENSLFVQRKATWETPNYGWKPASDSDYWTLAGDKYDYSGLYEGYVAAPSYGGNTLLATAGTTAGSIGEASIGAGRFILPTTHKYAAAPAANASYAGDYQKGNTAYVLVRAKYTPATYADGATANTDGTFYLGANGKYYTTAANAVNSTTGGVAGQTVAKYVGGKVIYYAWVNPDVVATPFNSPVLRNNIYHIHITGFKTIGTNWNPLFPENPETPMIDNLQYNPNEPEGPDNPKQIPDPKAPEKKNPDPKPNVPGVDEPTNPIDPKDPLTTPETWMSVDVKVLPWKVHSYEIDLGM